MTQQKKRLGLTIPNVLYKKILGIANYQGKTINSVCLEIFWDYFESNLINNAEEKENQPKRAARSSASERR